MPPSASAIPPTQTTQRVPKRSSKLTSRAGAAAGALGVLAIRGTEAGAACGGAGCGGGETRGGVGGETCGGASCAGSAAGGAAGCEGAAVRGVATTASPVSRAARRLSRRNSLSLTPPVLTRAIMATTGAASTKRTIRTINEKKSPIAAPRMRSVQEFRRQSSSAKVLAEYRSACSFEVEAERLGFGIRHRAAADRFDRRDHAAIAAQNLVGERDDADIRRRCR